MENCFKYQETKHILPKSKHLWAVFLYQNTSIYNMSDIDFQTQLFTRVHDVASLTFISYLI